MQANTSGCSHNIRVHLSVGQRVAQLLELGVLRLGSQGSPIWQGRVLALGRGGQDVELIIQEQAGFGGRQGQHQPLVEAACTQTPGSNAKQRVEKGRLDLIARRSQVSKQPEGSVRRVGPWLLNCSWYRRNWQLAAGTRLQCTTLQAGRPDMQNFGPPGCKC